MGFLSTWEKKYIVASNQNFFKFGTWEKIGISNCKPKRIQLSKLKKIIVDPTFLTTDYWLLSKRKKYPVAHEKLDIRVQIDWGITFFVGTLCQTPVLTCFGIHTLNYKICRGLRSGHLHQYIQKILTQIQAFEVFEANIVKNEVEVIIDIGVSKFPMRSLRLLMFTLSLGSRLG